MKKSVIMLLLPLALLAGCKDSGKTLTSATGSIYEMLVVMDNGVWETAAGDSVRKYMAADMPCLPQMESYFTLSQVSPALFDNLFMPTRNILFVDINADRYTQNKITYHTNVYSQPQALCRIQCASREDFEALMAEYGEKIQQWFVRQEIDRQGKFYQNYKTTEPRQAVQKHFKCDIAVPADYLLVADTAFQLADGTPIGLVWAVNDGGAMRRDLLIWSYPYTDKNTFTEQYLCQMRDSVMRHIVKGGIDGSYAGTEYRQIPPQMRSISVQKNAYCAELRGLWRMYNGTSMGGPFVEHTRLDEVSQMVITSEVFLFAPGQKKRNALRQQEAILYTLQLQQEINELKEVEVRSER